MKDYFCSESALALMKKITPADIDECIDTEAAPSGHVLITDNFTATYLMNRTDFKPTSRLLKYDDVLAIEYFENGIPEWLDPIPGVRIYLAEWTGSEWNFTNVQGI